MVKKTIKRPLRPGSDEIEEVEVENGDDAEGEIPSQLVPYPTGNPPDPMEEYYKANPERIPPEEAPAPEAAKAKAKPAPEQRSSPQEPEEDEKPYGKGKK
jgi:hypothetical protein